jgi:type IV secretion system protein VirD4
MSNNEFLRGKPRDAKDEQLLNLLMKAVTLLTVFTGIWLGTQRFAKLAGFDPGLAGNPFYIIQIKNFIYPLYQPLLLLYWSLIYFKRVQLHETLYNAWKITGWVSFSAIVFYFIVEFVLMKDIAQNIFGTARWANKKDLIKAGLLQNKGGMIIGQLTDANVYTAYDPVKDSIILHLRKPSLKIIQSGIYNTLLSAPTRSGKGVSNVQTTILSYPGSIIVLDFKGESFKFTSGYRKNSAKFTAGSLRATRGTTLTP